MDYRHRSLFPDRVRQHLTALVLLLVFVASSCGSDEDASSEITADATTATSQVSSDNPLERYPEILAAESEQAGDGSWSFSVTLSSPYDTPEQYADAWRVVGPDGSEFGFRLLAHDHANEQPFTRSQNGIVIPADVETVTIEARDQINGWGEDTLEHDLTQ